MKLAAFIEDEQLVKFLKELELLLALVHVAHVVFEAKQTGHLRLVHLREQIQYKSIVVQL